MRKLVASIAAVTVLMTAAPSFAKNDKEKNPKPETPAPTPGPTPTPTPNPTPTPAPNPTPTPAPNPTPTPNAKKTVVLPACSIGAGGDLSSPVATACVGFYDDNLLGGSADKITAQFNALTALGFNWNQDFSFLEDNGFKIGDNKGSDIVDFGKVLYGETVVGIHIGGGGIKALGGDGGSGTAFYKFDAGISGITSFLINLKASSGVVLYSTGNAPPPPPPPAVPEPATWAMMISGFGLAGAALRRRKRVTVSFA